MNDLIPVELCKQLPSLEIGIRKALSLLESVQSFEDIERLFLRGAGLSHNTYSAYLQSVKDFYQFTEAMHPLKVLPADIERWYDSMVKAHLSPATINLRIAGLRKFFDNVARVSCLPSPFNVMSENLTSKLRAASKDDRQKKPLYKKEVLAVLKYLREEGDPLDYVIFFNLTTTGLRASELLSLRGGDFEFDPEKKIWSCVFVGKGGRKQEQEMFTPAVDALIEYHGGTLPEGRAFPMEYHTLWHHFRAIGKEMKKRGLVRNSIQFSCHLTRRTYCTLLHKSGMSLRALQMKSRHKTLSVLVDHYLVDDSQAQPYLAGIFQGVDCRR